MRVKLVRLIAGTAAGLAAVLMVAGPANAATHPAAKTPTTLSITESRTTISPGESDRIGGGLLTGTKPVAGKVVYLYDYSTSAKKWESVAGEYTSSAGRVAFIVTPRHTTNYELVFHGTSTLAASHSGGATVLVARSTTTLSAQEAAAVIQPGQQEVISGVLLNGTTPAANEAVRLYRYSTSAHKWYLKAVALTGSAGTVAFTVSPGSTAYFQLVFDGSATKAGSHSGVVTVVVTKLPTTLSIQEASAAISSGHEDVISGQLLTGPAPVGQQDVSLYRYSSSDKKWLPLQVAASGSDGKVAFTVEPHATTDYELVFGGTASLYSSDSGTAVVTVIN
jgi:hypothetical protein